MTQRTIIPFGPQHPVLPEPIQLRLIMKDERVLEALPAIGYVHRGVEKLVEQKEYLKTVYLVERICGICSFMHAMNFCQGLESMLGLAVPERAHYLRVIWAELHRMHSHLLFLGLLADSFGFEALFMQAMRCREIVLEVMEKTAGGRILLGTCCIGGVRRDIDGEGCGEVLRALDEFEKLYEDVHRAFARDYSVRVRLEGKGVLSKEQAYELGAVGPVAKGSGLAADLRETGYAAYGALDFAPLTETGCDSFARMMVRAREILQSAALVRQSIKQMPAGPILERFSDDPEGEVVARIEQPRGELLFYIKADGSLYLERFRARTPTFANLVPLLQMLPGCELADVAPIVLSIDPCISCTER